MAQVVNRRRHERFGVRPMYTSISVRLRSDPATERQGHAYDVSEGGVRFELDGPIPAGTPVDLAVNLPGPGDDRTVHAFGNVVWVSVDPDEPGPVRMAAAFTGFASRRDRDLLLGRLSSGRYARAA